MLTVNNTPVAVKVQEGLNKAKRDAPAGKIYEIIEGERVYADDLDKYWACVFDLRNGISGEVIIDNTIDNSKLKDLTIQGGPNGKIAINTITGGENGNIAEKTITEFNLADDSVVTRTIKNLNVTREKINTKAITGGSAGAESKIDDKTITDANIADDAIITRTIANGNVTREKIRDKAIDANKIETKTILGGEDGNIGFDTLTGGTEVNKGNIAPNTIHLYNINGDICTGNIAEIDSWFTTSQ